MRLRLAALVAGITLALVSAAVAQETLGTRGGNKYVVSKGVLETHQTGTLKTSCPRGTFVIGGGFASDTFQLQASVSAPFDDDDPGTVRDNGWRTRQGHGEGPDQAMDFAICNSQRPRYVSRAKRPPPRTTVTTVGVHCPKGMHVLSGGGSARGWILVSSYPLDDGDPRPTPDDGWRTLWKARSGKGSPRAYAECSKSKPSYRSHKTPLPRLRRAEQSTQCAPHTHVVGVGAKVVSHPIGVELHEIIPTQGRTDVPAFGAKLGMRRTTDKKVNAVVYAVCTRLRRH